MTPPRFRRPSVPPPLDVSIAGFPIRLLITDPEVRRGMAARFRRFRAVHPGPLRFAPIFHSLKTGRRMTAPEVHAPPGEPIQISRRDFTLRLDRDKRLIDGACSANVYSIDTAVRVTLSAILLPERGALVHGAGLLVGDDAVLCPGQSGAGKSTLSQIAGARRVLSDELTGARLVGRGARIWGTPFQGEFQTGGLAEDRPLRGMFFLHRGRIPACRPLTPAEACLRLLRCCLFFDRSFEASRQLLSLTHQLCRRAPSFDFAFAMDESWPSIARRMRDAARF